MAQDDYYYEIQLTNKQLVFYFVAGAAGLVLAFLAGVMVGRSIDTGQGGTESARSVAEERVVAEPTPAPAPTDYSYAQRLEAERPADRLERPAATPAPTPSPIAERPVPKPTSLPAEVEVVTPPAPTPAPTPKPTPAPAAKPAVRTLPKAIGSSASVKGFSVQVGSFKDRASADVVARNLRGRGFPAYSVAPAGQRGGFFPVRVGVYRDRADARAVEERLREEKFQPIIIKQ